MSQGIRKQRLTSTSLRGRQDAHTVLLRMALEEERAARVRELKNQRPDLTWGRIAEHVGISERSVLQWQKTGGMSYTHAKKFAKLMDVSVDYVWSGTGDPPGTATPIDLDGDDQLDRIERKLDMLLEHFGLSMPADPGEQVERELEATAQPSRKRAGGSASTGRARKQAAR